MDIYEKLGVRPMINARGMKTRFGGAIMLPAVVDAMVAASRSSVYMTELQDVIGAKIAAMTGNEAAMVTGGAAAGIVLAIAACMTGDDREKMASLPDTRLMKNEAIVQHNMRFDEDCALKQTGARIVEISKGGSAGVEELETAINARTAAIFMLSASGAGTVPLSSVVPIARRHGVPVVVDDACGLPPAANLWKHTKEMGADLAIFSGGKGLRGPQSSGLVVGTKRLIEAMKMQASPHCYIGRAMKVGKEEMVGLYTAVECLLAAGDQEWLAIYEKQRRHIEARLNHLRFLKFKHDSHGVNIRWDNAAHTLVPSKVAEQMRSGNPPIECSGGKEGLYVNVESLGPGEDEIVAGRIVEILSSTA
jgi:uncharacterized pyridoxal phosphate-dependent enzyme